MGWIDVNPQAPRSLATTTALKVRRDANYEDVAVELRIHRSARLPVPPVQEAEAFRG